MRTLKQFGLLLAALLCALPAVAQQGGYQAGAVTSGKFLLPQTVAGLASLQFGRGTVVAISDGTNATDCSTGGGTTQVTCISSGSGWVAVGTSGTMVYPGAGLPISTGTAWSASITLGTGVSTALAANVSGSGSFCLTTSCAMTTPALGTPSALVLTNATGLPVAGLSGLGTGVGAALAAAVSGSGSFCLTTNCAMTTPALGTPSAAVLTNATGLPISTGVSGLGTGVAAALAAAVSGTGSICLSSGSSCSGGASLPSGVLGQTPVNNGGGPTSYSAQSPTLALANAGAAISLASANYTLLCDSATVATGIQDRGKDAKVGTGGSNSVVIPDLAGTGCSGMYGLIENASSGSITVARQTSDTFNVFGPSQGAPTTGATTFTLSAGQWATYSPSESATAYDVRIYGPSASGTGTVTDGAGVTTANELAVSTTTAHVLAYALTLPTAAVPAFSGDISNSAGSLTATVNKISGTSPGTNAVAAFGVSDSTFATNTTAIAANTCTTASTVTMTGVATSMAFVISPSTDVSGTTGWGSTGGLVIDAWPTANTLNYKVCNQTAASITPGASVTWNVGVR